MSHHVIHNRNSGPDNWHEHYERVLLRARFDQNKSITSLAKATELLKDGEEELYINQFYYKGEDHWLWVSEGGAAYHRHLNEQVITHLSITHNDSYIRIQ